MPVDVATKYIDDPPEEELVAPRRRGGSTSRRGSVAAFPRSRSHSNNRRDSAAGGGAAAASTVKLSDSIASSSAPEVQSVVDPDDPGATLSALSKQFLSDLAATHHQAAFQDNRERQAAYTAKLKAALAAEEEMDRAAAAGDEAVAKLQAERAARVAPPPRPESPTAVQRRAAIAAKIAVGARLRALGVPCEDPETSFVGMGSM